MQIQVDLPEDLNKKLKIDRINSKVVNMREMLIIILTRYYKLKEDQIFDKQGNKIKL